MQFIKCLVSFARYTRKAYRTEEKKYMKKLVQINKFVKFIEGNEDDTTISSATYFLSPILGNMCEEKAEGGCTSTGLYFGTDDIREGVYCPCHYFKEDGYVIKPLK